MQFICLCYTEMPASDEGNMRRSSRSGRLLLPPLAFWANERLIVPHRRGTSTQLVIDNQSFDISTDAAQVMFTPPLVCEQIGMSVCLSASIFLKCLVQTLPDFLCVFPVAMAESVVYLRFCG